MKYKQHVPGFVDADPKLAEFNTVDELLEIPFVKSWKQYPGFVKFSVSDRSPKYGVNSHLMAEYFDNGKHSWWVLGYIENMPKDFPLPDWVCPDRSPSATIEEK